MDKSKIYAYLKQISMESDSSQMPPQWSYFAMGPEGHEVAAHLFTSDMMVVYLHDEGSHYSWVTAAEMQEMGLTPDELKELGIENLTKLISNYELHNLDGAFMMTGEPNDFLASIMLVPQFWDLMVPAIPGNPVKGAPVVCVAARDVFVFCGTESDPTKHALMRQQAQAIHSSGPDHPLSSNLYTRTTEGTWVVFDPADEAPSPKPASASGPVSSNGSTAEPAAAQSGSASGEEIVISNTELVGAGNMLNSHQIGLMAKAGFYWDPSDQSFHRRADAEGKLDELPWKTQAWQEDPEK